MIIFIGTVVMSDDFSILLPKNLAVLGARFVCTILMHLQVEGDLRQGLQMMKYVTNHASEFSAARSAFVVALMQSLAGLMTEIACIVYLGSVNSPMDVIIRFVALASVAKVDDFYAGALPDGNRIKNKSRPMKIKVHRRDMIIRAEKGEVDFSYYLSRFVYKTLRLSYASFIFYFMPYVSIFLPYAAMGYHRATRVI